jgi:hypothetical protein
MTNSLERSWAAMVVPYHRFFRGKIHFLKNTVFKELMYFRTFVSIFLSITFGSTSREIQPNWMRVIFLHKICFGTFSFSDDFPRVNKDFNIATTRCSIPHSISAAFNLLGNASYSHVFMWSYRLCQLFLLPGHWVNLLTTLAIIPGIRSYLLR